MPLVVLIANGYDDPAHLQPLPGGLVAAAWTAAMIGLAVVSFSRLEV